MFFEKEYKYNIIEDVDIKIIENALERNNVHLSIIDNSTEWCAFAHYYGLKNGFNSIHCASFAYMISLCDWTFNYISAVSNRRRF